MKRMLVVILGAGLLVVVGAMFGPRTAHAVIATLVRDVDNPARDSFQANFPAACTGSVGFSNLDCTGTGLVVPTTNGNGQSVSMLVIEYVSGIWAPAGFLVTLTNYTPAELQNDFFGTATSSTSGKFFQNVVVAATNPNLFFAQQTRLYAAPGTQLITLNNNCTFHISGYLVTQ